MLPISESIVRQHASHQSYQRGEEYYRAGAVIDLQRRVTAFMPKLRVAILSPIE